MVCGKEHEVIVQQLIYSAATRRPMSGLGQNENMPAQTMTGPATMIASMLESAQGTYRVSAGNVSLVIDALSNNWGAGPYGVGWGSPHLKGYLSDLPFQPGSKGGAALLDAHKGEWIVVVGDPFGEQCQPVSASTQPGQGCRLKVFATPSMNEAIAFADENYAVTSDGMHLNAFVLVAGEPELPESVQAGVDKIKSEIQRAALGLRWGAIIGGALGIGAIVAAEMRSRR
jgi:hypothetical protein